MPPKIFLTGSTGYIGGSVLHTLTTTHPDWPITVLLRRPPPNFDTLFPSIKILIGDYDSTSLLSSAASESDIVIHCGDSDHVPCLSALISGLLHRKTPGHLIHLSGTGIVSDHTTPSFSPGSLNPKTWSDTSPADLDEIRNLPATALHRATEKLLHETIASQSDNIHIAIIFPPDIYGRGKGPGKQLSALVPMFVAEARKLGSTFFVGEGANTRSWVHVHDLMRVYLHIIEAAASGDEDTTKRFFGANGYHFASTQEVAQREFAGVVGGVLKRRGVLESAEPKRVDVQVLDGMVQLEAFPGLARYLFASNSRTRADRARREWGFEAEAVGLLEGVEEDVVNVLEGK